MSVESTPSSDRRALDRREVGGRYANYVLFVLVIVYVFNFLDRQILSILAEHIKADLGVSDAEIGFLYGTAFAVFYAVFGIPLGRLADVWVRRSLIAIGLAFWSVMTALSGLACSFTQLAAARIGVGIGEASASPAAFSLLSDCFPPRRRATVIAIYSSGIYIGAGLGLFIGGPSSTAGTWRFPAGERTVRTAVAGRVPRGRSARPAAGRWVATLREPERGAREGIARIEPHPFMAAWRELLAVVPPFTLIAAARRGRRALLQNIAAAGVVTIIVLVLIELIGNKTQWIALGVGVYAAISWAQNLAAQDRPRSR